MKTAQSLEIIYKTHLPAGHKEAMEIVAAVVANVIDDLDLDGQEVTAKALELGLEKKALLHKGQGSKEEVA
jgi:hypothetical protein